MCMIKQYLFFMELEFENFKLTFTFFKTENLPNIS